MHFYMERRAPYALAVQAAVVLAGVAALAIHLLKPAPPPLPCATPAQILYDHHTSCLPSVDAMFRALAAPAGQDFVRAAYVRDGANGAWMPAEHAGYQLLRDAQGASTITLASVAAADSAILPYRAVVELTARLVTKD